MTITRMASGRADSLYGKGLAALFPGGMPIALAPWQPAGRRIDEDLYDQQLVDEALARRELVPMDPRDLYGIQPNVTLAGVRYYMGDEYARTGRTFADQDRETNRFPIIYRRARNGQNVILTGHHRAAAALLQGRPLEAIYVKEPEGYGQHTGHHDAVRRRPALAARRGPGADGQAGREGHPRGEAGGAPRGRVGRGGEDAGSLHRGPIGHHRLAALRQDRLAALDTSIFKRAVDDDYANESDWFYSLPADHDLRKIRTLPLLQRLAEQVCRDYNLDVGQVEIERGLPGKSSADCFGGIATIVLGNDMRDKWSLLHEMAHIYFLSAGADEIGLYHDQHFDRIFTEFLKRYGGVDVRFGEAPSKQAAKVASADTETLWRGLRLRVPAQSTDYARGVHALLSSGPLGSHWTESRKVAEKFARDDGYSYTTPKATSVAVLIEAEVDPLHITPPEVQLDYGGGFNGEQEQYLDPGTEVQVRRMWVATPEGEGQRTTAGDLKRPLSDWQEIPVPSLRFTSNRLADVAQAAQDAIDIALDNWRPDKGMFALGKDVLDPRIFDGERLKPAVRQVVLGSLDAYWRPLFGDWTQWAKVYLAGSGASYWWDSDTDLDLMVGVDLARLRAARPANVEVSDSDIVHHLNKTLMDLRPSMAAVVFEPGTEPFAVTYFVNDGGAYDVDTIHPYAAYDVTEDRWVVKPPVLPKDWGPGSIPDETWRKCEQWAREARATLALPEPERTIEGTKMFDWIHEGRKAAYSAYGGGWLDPGNVAYQYLSQTPDHLLRSLYLCKHPEEATAADALEKTAGAAEVPWSEVERTNKGFGTAGPMLEAYVRDRTGKRPEDLHWTLETHPTIDHMVETMASPTRIADAEKGYREHPDQMPPVVILEDEDGEREHIDGWHRLVGAERAGLSEVPAYVARWSYGKESAMAIARAAGHLPGGIPARVADVHSPPVTPQVEEPKDIRLVILDKTNPEAAAAQLFEHADTLPDQEQDQEKTGAIYPTQRKTVGEWDKALMHDLTATHGFTMHDHPGDAPTSGYMVSIDQSSEQKMPLMDVTPQAIADYMSVHQQELKDPNNYLGGWVFRGVTYLDISRWVPDQQQAIALAKANHQLGIYDLGTGQTVMTDAAA